MNKKIYFDHAATTDMLPEVAYAMEPYYFKRYGNASTTYELGRTAREAIEQAREDIANCIGAKSEEIFFTSGGSESDNWAIKNTAGERKQIGQHIITSQIEHHAVLHSCEYLEKLGYSVTYLDVNKDGRINPASLERALRENAYKGKTTLISIMFANNEIGTIQPIEELGRLAQKYDCIFHTDAVQAVGQVPIQVKRLPIDMLSASAHKFHGPKGVGFLYIREGVPIHSFIHGGSQERGKRAGTENVAGIVGMAKALKLVTKEMSRTQRKVTELRDYFARRVLREIPDVILNGHPVKRLPGNLNFSFKNVSGTELLILLEENGIFASAGSACTAGDTSLSHVIQAIKVPKEYAYGTIRFSLGRENTLKEVEEATDVLVNAVQVLRNAL